MRFAGWGRDERDENLEALRRAKIDRLTDRIIGRAGSNSEPTLEDIDELTRVGALRESLRSTTPRRVAAGVLALALLGGGLLVMSNRVDEAKITLAMTATELGFTLDSAGPFTQTVGLRSLHARGLRGIQLQDYKGRPEVVVESPQIELAATDPSRVGLAPLRAGSQTRVDVARIPARPLEFRILVADSTTALNVSLTGSFTLATQRGSEPLVYPGTRPAPLKRVDPVVDVTVAMPDSSKSLFLSPLAIRELEPFRRIRTDDEGSLRPVSTLRSARLAFPGIDGQERDIHPSELIEITIVNDGRLRELEMKPDRLVIAFAGTVSNVKIDGKTAMPTLVEKLAAQHTVPLLWGAATYAFVTLLAIWRWWRNPA